MNNKSKLILILFLFTNFLYAELDENLYIFGTIQGIMINENTYQIGKITERTVNNEILNQIEQKNRYDRNIFAIQQFDLFLNKFWTDEFNLFVDLEFTMNYDNEKKFGNLALREAWINYKFSDQVQIKAGQFFPAFNNLNEYKNRLNLLPYIIRPIVYEKILDEVLSAEDYIPERANLQIHGQIPVSQKFIDWALYIGNSETSELSKNEDSNSADDDFLSGVDMNDLSKKLYGGRLGFRNKTETLKFGFSGTTDFNNGDTFFDQFKNPTTDSLIDNNLNIEDQKRYRVGFDFSARYDGFNFEHEYIYSFMDDIVYSGVQIKNGIENKSSWNRFWYSNLTYDINDIIQIYSGYAVIDFEVSGNQSKAYYISSGFQWSVNPWLSLKGQYIYYNQIISFPLPKSEIGTFTILNVEQRLFENLLVFGFTANF